MGENDTDFDKQQQQTIEKMGQATRLQELTRAWFNESCEHQYSYHFKWLGRPIIQYPQDIVALQEIIWSMQPDLIVETGVARGGSLVFSASLLELLGGDRQVLGIDIDIRPHNREAIEAHPLAKRITLLQGSSISEATRNQVYALAKNKKRILVILDSNHTHEHVLQELRLYSPLVRQGGYLIVFDTVIEDMPAGAFADRPWSKGNNPKTAVAEFLRENNRFVIDRAIENKLQITVAPSGYLRCLKD